MPALDVNFLTERTNCKASTRAALLSIVKANLLPEFGNVPLSAITESHIRKFQARLSASIARGSDHKLSPARINTIMQPLRSILAQAYRKHLDRIWARALRKAGMRHRPSYQLRHTFATQCIIKGSPLPFIAKVLGHSTIGTLIRHYAGWIDQATKEHKRKLVESFRMTVAVWDTPQIGKVEGKGEGMSGREKHSAAVTSVRAEF